MNDYEKIYNAIISRFGGGSNEVVGIGLNLSTTNIPNYNDKVEYSKEEFLDYLQITEGI